jgi:hypothetical protein
MIRKLHAGEPIPAGMPAKYVTSAGYVLLRWKLGPRDYVECLEHRVVAGNPAGRVVHHRNGDRSDNRSANLEVLTRAEHNAEHSVIDALVVRDLYRAGRSTVEIGEQLGYRSASIWKALQRIGEPSMSRWQRGCIRASQGHTVIILRRTLGVDGSRQDRSLVA